MLATKYKFLQFTIEWEEWQGLFLVRGLSYEWVSDLRPARETMAPFYYFEYVNTCTYRYTDLTVMYIRPQKTMSDENTTNCFKDKNHLP